MGTWGLVADAVVPVFLVIALGTFFGRRGTLNIKPFVDFIIYVAMPALIIQALANHPLSLDVMVMTGTGTLFVVGFVGGLTILYQRLSGDRGRDVLVCALFANAANLPLPLANFAFGAEGLSYQVIYMTVNMVLLYSLGIGIANGGGKAGLMQLFKLPLLYAAGLGIVLSTTHIELPAMVMRPVSMVGDTAIPLLLFSLGYRIGAIKLSDIWSALPIVALRVLGGAAAGLSFVWLFAPEEPVARAVLLGCAMPSAVQSFMLCAKFCDSSDRAAAAVFLSTLLGFLYIPFVVGWLA